MERDANARMALEGVDHRQVGALEGLGDDPAEVANGLMVVEGQRQRDPASQRDLLWVGHGVPATGSERVQIIVAADH